MIDAESWTVWEPEHDGEPSFPQAAASNSWQETEEGRQHNTVHTVQQLPFLCLSASVSVCMFSVIHLNSYSGGGLTPTCTLLTHWLADTNTHTHTKTNLALCHTVRAVCCHVVNGKIMFPTSNAVLCVYLCEEVVCVVLSLSNYLLQPSDNNGGLIKAKPGGVYTLVVRWQLPPCPESINRTGMMAPTWHMTHRETQSVFSWLCIKQKLFAHCLPLVQLSA